MRLRAEGVEAPTFDFLGGIDYVRWFLEPAGDYRSSNQLEVALSEFELQGLEKKNNAEAPVTLLFPTER